MLQSLPDHCNNVCRCKLHVLADWRASQQGSSGFDFDSESGQDFNRHPQVS